MKVAIDLTALLPVKTGVDIFLKNLVLHFGKIDEENSFRIYVNYEDRHIFDHCLPDNYTIVPRSLRLRAIRLLFQQLWFPFDIDGWADVVHSPSFLMPFYRGRQRHMLTVYDMTFFSLPGYHNALRRSQFFRHMILKSILRTDLVQVPSQSTKQDVLNYLPQVSPERIHVIPYGLGHEFRIHSRDEVLNAVKRFGLPTPYILYVGTIEPRKNVASLVESYKTLLKMGISEHLVLVGPFGWGYQELLKKIRSDSLKNRVHLLGYVNHEDLPGIYAGARLFVYPSFYEGFGLPPLEAMACGLPTITSRTSALEEYYKVAAVLVSPTDKNALTEAMKRLLFDDALRAEYRDRGLTLASMFKWEKTAARMLDCYKLLAEK
ncbi:glycosyltransferase family 4 protein [candidate division CSSED10-310 bacterium]|uniref:Glycosyltransferase family 4 protein n=1 Tax=candidate division CSSED10-310 bacterium TaxID=2855610 RepID=A0ABV6YTL3_UNCC1